jgi:uncharacterized domain 1
MDSQNYDIEKILQRYDSDYVFHYLGVKILEIKEGYAKTQIPFKKELTRRGNILNGGMIVASIDYTSGLAVLSINDGMDQVTQELKVNFLEPMYRGPFTVEANVIRKGRTAVAVEITFKDVEGSLGAIGLGTWYIIRDKKINMNVQPQ